MYFLLASAAPYSPYDIGKIRLRDQKRKGE